MALLGGNYDTLLSFNRQFLGSRGRFEEQLGLGDFFYIPCERFFERFGAFGMFGGGMGDMIL